MMYNISPELMIASVEFGPDGRSLDRNRAALRELRQLRREARRRTRAEGTRRDLRAWLARLPFRRNRRPAKVC